MSNKIYLKKSGIPLVDEHWGGFYDGATYLLIGKQKSGKTTVSLQYARECALQNEVCVYFTHMRPKDLLIYAATIDFDLESYMNKNKIIVIKVAIPADVNDMYERDNHLIDYFNDIVSVIDDFKPNKIVFDEFTEFTGFTNDNLLRDVFQETIEKIEDRGVTSLFVLSDPANSTTEKLVNNLVGCSTGIVYLDKDTNKNTGEIIVTPGIGHPEGKERTSYMIEPYKGISLTKKKIVSNSALEKVYNITNSRNTNEYLNFKKNNV